MKRPFFAVKVHSIPLTDPRHSRLPRIAWLKDRG